MIKTSAGNIRKVLLGDRKINSIYVGSQLIWMGEKHPFSVSSSKKVEFSKGNLQYRASTNEWRLAPNQYSYIGLDNRNISQNYNGWIDLFGWGTSGNNNKFPYLTSTDYSDYGDGNNDIAGTEYDWGVHNRIDHYQEGVWRIMTEDEWRYLYYRSSNLRTRGQIDGVNGYIFLPDDWEDRVQLVKDAEEYRDNLITVEAWKTMEDNGAIFLPAAGGRTGKTLVGVDNEGHYWTGSTRSVSRYAVQISFKTNFFMLEIYNRSAGFAVRLVRNTKSQENE